MVWAFGVAAFISRPWRHFDPITTLGIDFAFLHVMNYKNFTPLKTWFLQVSFWVGYTVLLPAQDNHQIWTQLLTKHLSESGKVDYKGFIRDSQLLNQYLISLANNPPQSAWDAERAKAYWINAYNAFTVQLIIRHYPVKSIKEIGGRIPLVNSPWDIKFIRIGNELMDLNHIEHSILRKKFSDPRLHMALVCASRSCPALHREAFEPTRLNQQLDFVTKKFLSDPFRNELGPQKKASISMIFKWYAGDFGGTRGVRNFISKYGPAQNTVIRNFTYKDYDWSLND